VKSKRSRPKPAEPPAGEKFAPRRRWFRILALLLPLALLGLAEMGLRLGGYGYPTSYFLPSQAGGRPVFIENQQFTRRFFPPGLARSPQPVLLPAAKPPQTCRIFLLGESAAMGDPAPAYGVGRILEVLLRERYPGQSFEVVNVAITAINSHVARKIALDCARRAGDVWIVYLGHNEVIGPFGAGTVFSAQAPNRAVIRAQLAFKSLRLGQLVDDLKYRIAPPAELPSSWEGMEMFLRQQIRADDPRLARVYAHFAANLADILETGKKSGARLLLSTVVSNLKDCPPFASVHRPGLNAAELESWNRHYQAGMAEEAATNTAAALAAYQEAARIDDTYAELAFRRGRCFWTEARYAEACLSFERAHDLDALRFRADSKINTVIREAARAQAGPGFKFVDAVEGIAQESPHGIAGRELLYEHVHLNFEGNYRLARLFAEQLQDLLPASITGAAAKARPWLEVRACARRLAWTDWDRYQVADEMVKRLEQPPFTTQLDHPARLQAWRQLRAELEPAARPKALTPAAGIYQEALRQSPADWVLHERLGQLLERAGDLAGAEQAYRQVLALLPHYAQADYHLGNVLEAEGRGGEAQAFFKLALRKRPDLVEARNGLGLILANEGKTGEAMAQFEKALRQKPQFTEARINLGQLLARQGRAAEAQAHYLQALRANSNSVAAHVNLGALLSAQGNAGEAALHYREAVRLQPDNAIAHFNLGNALARQSNPEALAQYAEAARLKPDFAEAHYNLAMQLVDQGRQDEALPHLAETVRWQPDFAEAHFNYGIALAKAGRFDEAIPQFEATLRLQPAHSQARQALEKVRQMRGGRKLD
jgi:tetratricopeptide (TPR) repeat protein